MRNLAHLRDNAQEKIISDVGRIDFFKFYICIAKADPNLLTSDRAKYISIEHF